MYLISYERIVPLWMGSVKLPRELREKVRIRNQLYNYKFISFLEKNKMRGYIFIITGILFLFFNEIEAQSSLKRSKQTTRFHYLQANLHAGYLSNLERIDLSTSGPKNRLVYQYLAKNQRLLQQLHGCRGDQRAWY